MAFRILRLRKEARRNAKLEEIFQERDKEGSGMITFEQLEDIYRIYQVDFDEGRASKIIDQQGQISKEDFTQYAKETHLLDLDSALGDAMLLLSPRRSRKQPHTPKKGNSKHTENSEQSEQSDKGCYSVLSCFRAKSKNDAAGSREKEERLQRVEAAFHKFDLDKDGFLSWEEFQQMGRNLDQEQALRIFQICNQSGTGLISLEEFLSMVVRGDEYLENMEDEQLVVETVSEEVTES